LLLLLPLLLPLLPLLPLLVLLLLLLLLWLDGKGAAPGSQLWALRLCFGQWLGGAGNTSNETMLLPLLPSNKHLLSTDQPMKPFLNNNNMMRPSWSTVTVEGYRFK
jgi:hypothetical protein